MAPPVVRRFGAIWLPVLAAFLAAAPRVRSQSVPSTLAYQGVVSVTGTPFTGDGRFKFALVSPDGAVSHWSNDGTSVAGSEPAASVVTEVRGGGFAVALGDSRLPNMAPVPARVFQEHPDVHLRVWFSDGIRGFQRLQPDRALASAGYALMADRAAGLVAGARIEPGNIPPGTVNPTHLGAAAAPLPGQVLSYDGAGLAWSDPAPGGGGDSVFSLNGSSAYYNGGRVGIGTAIPAGTLHVAGGGVAVTGEGSPFGGAGRGVFIESSAAFGGRVFAYDYAAFAPRPLLLNSPGGPVGIGTPVPRSRLEVAETWDSNWSANIQISGNRPTLMWSQSVTGAGGVPGGRNWIAHMNADGSLVFYRRRTELGLGGTDTGWEPRLTLDAGTGNLGVAGELVAPRVTSLGDVAYAGRIGKLDTQPQFDAVVRSADFLLGHPTRRGEPGRALVDWKDGAGTRSLVINWADDWPETWIGGGVTQVKTLRITGGADLAEPFAMSDGEVSPGAVVVIDERHPGRLRRSDTAYDRKVAGVVSGADGIQPGISMIQEGLLEAGRNVALSGRVRVRANTSGGPVRPGDLMTTSDVPGEAMRAADPARSQGAVLGKAMTALESGSGTVLVLVTLQ